MNKLLERYGSWALITGASSGLGAEFAKQLGANGFNLVLVARRAERLHRLADALQHQYGIQTQVIAVDLADPDFMERLETVLHHTEVGLLIMNAGFSLTGEFLRDEIQKHEQLWNVNCRSVLRLSHAFGRQMENRGRGGMVIVSSSVAFAPVPQWTHYAASKAYSLFLGEGLSHELKKQGIDVLTLCPGGMKTEFQDVAGISSTGAMSAGPIAKLALRKLGKKNVLVPGIHIRMLFYFLPKLLPRRRWLDIISRLIYGLKNDYERHRRNA